MSERFPYELEQMVFMLWLTHLIQPELPPNFPLTWKRQQHLQPKGPTLSLSDGLEVSFSLPSLLKSDNMLTTKTHLIIMREIIKEMKNVHLRNCKKLNEPIRAPG